MYTRYFTWNAVVVLLASLAFEIRANDSRSFHNNTTLFTDVNSKPMQTAYKSSHVVAQHSKLVPSRKPSTLDTISWVIICGVLELIDLQSIFRYFIMAVIQTVLGPITPSRLGRALTHEHLSLDFEAFHSPPPSELKEFFEEKISLENIGFVHQYPYSSLENLRFYGEAAENAIKKDVQLYKRLGGDSIVENSCHGLQRNLELMVDVQKTTGVNIIAGTGHYVHNLQSKNHLKMTIEQLTDLYSKEIITGVDVDNIGPVKCGYIGEVGSVYPIHEFEKRAIQATGEIQEVLGCGVSFHPGRDSRAPFEIVRLYLEAGGRADKCIMSHLDRTISHVEELLEFATLGTYLQYDLFGIECSYYQLNPTVDMPSDGQRINNLVKLIDNGLVNRLLMSHDIHTKHRLTSYGGHGYHHVHVNILPRLLSKGVTFQQIEQMTVANPANWLQFQI